MLPVSSDSRKILFSSIENREVVLGAGRHHCSVAIRFQGWLISELHCHFLLPYEAQGLCKSSEGFWHIEELYLTADSSASDRPQNVVKTSRVTKETAALQGRSKCDKMAIIRIPPP